MQVSNRVRILLKQCEGFIMPENTEYLAALEKAIQLRCRCTATYRQTVFVHEKTEDNETVWFGDVEVFDLIGCKGASRCYAWLNTEHGVRVVTILHSRVVGSACRAVQAAIFSGVQPPMPAAEEDSEILKRNTEKAKQVLR